jgi:hypothetical protein
VGFVFLFLECISNVGLSTDGFEARRKSQRSLVCERFQSEIQLPSRLISQSISPDHSKMFSIFKEFDKDVSGKKI